MVCITFRRQRSRGETVTNPFDDADAEYLVLVNEENQHSLWPAFADVPSGWAVVHDRDTRRACVAYIDAHWTDLRPPATVVGSEHDSSLG
ncbi:MbtH-like protein [Prescottella equi 103S]|uniref:MbtH-like protein n=1 Tax=Rhodococcus hoagii (strain 103S) TaxID=685727 RepID=A0A3S5Y7F3_RHOH1|nr:MbtH-like protein [Prescottella equi 103S]